MIHLRVLIWGMVAATLLSFSTLSNAIEDGTPRVHALVGARVVIQPGQILDNATIIVRDGMVEAVGNVQPPADARIWDVQGKTIYPGLIEAYFDPTSKKKPKKGPDQASDKQKAEGGNRHPNARVRAERRVAEEITLSLKQLDALRSMGFTTVHVVPAKGIFRGQSAVMNLCDGTVGAQLVVEDVAQLVAFERSGWRDKNPTYPSSLMGAMALVRQTLLDAAWLGEANAVYAKNKKGLERPQSNLSLEALQSVLAKKNPQPVWLQTGDVLGSLRCLLLAKEFGLEPVLVGNGEEYQNLATIARAHVPVVLPVNFPKAPKIEDEDDEVFVELTSLQHWKAAPANAAKLIEANVPVALTSHGLKKRNTFIERIREAIEAGLTPEAALASLTTEPAKLLGVADQLGTIAVGKVANLTMTNGDLFDEKVKVLEVWVDGQRYLIEDKKNTSVAKVRGTWKLVAGDADDPQKEWTLEVKGNRWTLRATLEDEKGEVPIKSLRWHEGKLYVELASSGEIIRLSPAGKKLEGTWTQASGDEIDVAASRPEASTGGGR